MISLSPAPTSRNFLKTRKSVFLIILVIIAFLLLVSLFIVYQKKTTFSRQSKNIEKMALSYEDIDPTRVASAFEKINNTKFSDRERFRALNNVYFYFSSAYSTTHKTGLREFVNSTLDPFAKKYFPDLYESEGELIIPCADPICGQDFSDDLREIRDIVKKSSMDSNTKNVIEKNLTTASYIPNSNKDEKLSGFSLVKRQLEESGNEDASRAAALLKNYANSKYGVEI